nr:carbohydrate kinase [Desulfobulbaceae bacterium]
MIICIGEIVWDIFASKKALGGAPLNVAYHLQDMGQNARIISKVGHDEYGQAAIQKIEQLGLTVNTIQYDPKYPTGQVLVHLDDTNEPSFEILSPAAWDFIHLSEISRLTQNSYHLVCGTLAQRSAISQSTIRSLQAGAETVFYDVNLRPPYTPRECVLNSLEQANVGKVNEDELAVINKWSSLPEGGLEEMALAVLDKFHLEVLAVTLGGKGAMLVCHDGVFQHGGFPVKVADPVGAGDAFFAALINGILRKRNWQECLVQANKRGAFVASQHGATPVMKHIQDDLS